MLHVCLIIENYPIKSGENTYENIFLQSEIYFTEISTWITIIYTPWHLQRKYGLAYSDRAVVVVVVVVALRTDC